MVVNVRYTISDQQGAFACCMTPSSESLEAFAGLGISGPGWCRAVHRQEIPRARPGPRPAWAWEVAVTVITVELTD